MSCVFTVLTVCDFAVKLLSLHWGKTTENKNTSNSIKTECIILKNRYANLNGYTSLI